MMIVTALIDKITDDSELDGNRLSPQTEKGIKEKRHYVKHYQFMDASVNNVSRTPRALVERRE